MTFDFLKSFVSACKCFNNKKMYQSTSASASQFQHIRQTRLWLSKLLIYLSLLSSTQTLHFFKENFKRNVAWDERLVMKSLNKSFGKNDPLDSKKE